jgi:hypothetical protein
MHYELWDISSGNFIMAAQTRENAHRLVRELLEDGWSADDISSGWGRDSNDDPPLPKAISGEELLREIYGPRAENSRSSTLGRR